MSVFSHLSKFLPVLAISLAGPIATALADRSEDRYYQAYYLETERGDWEGAAKLYAKVAKDSDASKAMRRDAKARLAACTEELAVSDFARLMPPDALAYVELKKPGKQLAGLLDQLGLLAGNGKQKPSGGRHVAVSPVLLKEVLGLGGVAVAVTGFDPRAEEPSGVVVLHPGSVEVVRGLLETALPVAAQAVESIGGYDTYNIENEALVTLTSRLVIASTERSEIEGVVARLKNKKKKSLADSQALAEIRGDDEALLTFFVNAKPILPMIHEAMASEGMDSHELAMAHTLLDIESLNSIMGRVAITDDGLSLDLGVRLDEGHHNLVYNFLRTPALNHETLKCIPEGAAVVLAGAINEADSKYSSGSSNEHAAYVTALDLGREIFANVTSVAMFVLPPDDGRTESGPPIPDVAVALTVNDPAKSTALWTQILGLAHMASGGANIQGKTIEISGVSANQFKLPNGMGMFFANAGNDVIVSPSRSAIARAIQAKRKGRSILKDEAFAAALSGVHADTSKAIFIHAGRAASVAKRFVPPHEMEHAAPIMAMLSDTVISLAVRHSAQQFLVSAKVTGIPDVGPMVSHLASQEFGGHSHHAKHRHDERKMEKKERSSTKHTKTKKARKTKEEQQEKVSVRSLMKKFDALALKEDDQKAANKVGRRILRAAWDDANTLNTFAWNLMTKDRYDNQYDELALKCSKRSNELSDLENWAYVDTLALALFLNGDADGAVKLEKKAIKLCGDCSGLHDLKDALKRFKAE